MLHPARRGMQQFQENKAVNPLDNPLVLSILFYPRAGKPSKVSRPGIYDGTIPVENEIVLGYRLYVHQPGSPVFLYFHGNGEIASDYDGIAADYQRIGVSLLVVDYRGYGWSTGRPLVSTLLPDSEAVVRALPDILRQANLSSGAWFIMGRSLGSACAIHTASQYPDQFRGLIIESGFAHVIPLLARLGLPTGVLAAIPDGIGNVSKMQFITLPLLVIHGEKDSLIPIANGQTLYNTSPAQLKHLVRIPGAGHNDLLMVGPDRYFAAIAQFVAETSETRENTP
jgi:pimeloyl-ACP methyl ester carboxylesterase